MEKLKLIERLKFLKDKFAMLTADLKTREISDWSYGNTWDERAEVKREIEKIEECCDECEPPLSFKKANEEEESGYCDMECECHKT